MPTRNVVLTDHEEELVESLVGSGRYRNAREVLREEAGAGFGALDRGEFKEFESIDDLQVYLIAISDKLI